jgi:hypothetical protein
MRPCLQNLYSSSEGRVSCPSQPFIRTLGHQQLLAEASLRANLNLTAPALSDLSTSNQKSEDETAKHALNAIPATPGVKERCICGYEPNGQERNKVSNLMRHQKTCKFHSPQGHNNKSFSCSYPGCNKAYNRSDALVVHRRNKHDSLSNVKACSGCLCLHSSEGERSMNATSSSRQRLHRQGAIHVHERPKRRAPSLSPQQDLLEDEVVQRAVPKRRRLINQEPVEPYSWVRE